MPDSFLDLLYDEAPRAAFDAVVAGADALPPGEAAELRRQYDVALRLRELIARQRSREAELSALYETAGDLTAIRDVNAILAAIVRRARQLLNADMTYLSLNDEGEGASYMKVTDGALTAEFRRLRLPLGTGLLGLVAQTGAPYFTQDYQSDERFVHRGYIDDAVAGERIRAILGVPLVVDGRVIGTLLATHRTVRPFPPEEVSLLTSFAAHAAVALENARLFAELDDAHRRLRDHTRAVEEAAFAHDRLTDLLLRGSGVVEVVEVLAGVLGGDVAVLDVDGTRLAGDAGDADRRAAVAGAVGRAVASGRSVEVDGGYLAPAMAGQEHLATVVVHGSPALDEPQRRTLERGAMVAGLVLLFARSVDETEQRLGGALLTDLVEGSQDTSLLRARARRQRAVLPSSSVLAVATVRDLDRPLATRVAARLARAASGLACEHQGRVVLLVAASEEGPVAVGERLAAAIGTAGGVATVGVVGCSDDPLGGGLPATYAEARRCADALVALGREGAVSDPTGLGVTRLLLGTSGPDELATFVETTLGPVLAYDAARGTRLRTTLEAWFAAGGRLRDVAAALHVHPNTVTQRLERVTVLLGEGWRDPARALDLQLALRVAALRSGSTD